MKTYDKVIYDRITGKFYTPGTDAGEKEDAMKLIKFRQEWICQKGHKRWAYFTVVTKTSKYGDTTLDLKWGPRNCSCPTYEIGEGYAPFGSPQLFTGIVDRKGIEIYEGDSLKAYVYDGIAEKPVYIFTAEHIGWDEDMAGFGICPIPKEKLLEGWKVEYEIIGKTKG